MNRLNSLGLHTSFSDSFFDAEAAIAEDIFGTIYDSGQIPITTESRIKLRKLSPYCFNCALDNNERPVSWVVCIPTTVELMNKFIQGEVTEKEMFDQTPVSTSYSALYLCSVITIPEYRRKGIAKGLLVESIEKFKYIHPQIELFAWAYSMEGRKVVESLPHNINIRQE